MRTWTHTHTHEHAAKTVSQLVSQVMSSNRPAVTVLMDWHDSISLSSSASLSFHPSLLLLFFHLFPPNQAAARWSYASDIYTKMSKPGLEYVTVYPVGQLSNQSTSLCNQTATQWSQPASFTVNQPNQPARLCAFLLLHPSAWLRICICLFNSLSLPVYQTVSVSHIDGPLCAKITVEIG